ncbi:diacylglycerol/lipid kinase family protein [Sphingomonas sp.]|jgi:diacylglycerol kinase family enzyme|uniref:diacylglycerol/lipid kinase family protein n=1 Tax=Sphingomonas sp. TaxID=28214 RepID=UPI002E37E886|nr:diacylglycerol kinase family protein [Sphingomonas sp.]HEX4694983.1 diacylglycerol kinase family protein [Sphingomonas sp.]
MQRIWFITNPASGSSDAAKAEAIEAVCVERGLAIVGRTNFPEAGLPTHEELDAAGADTVALFAGDGTINAAVCALASWDGAILILPGGTMNMLAKVLHGDADPHTIVAAAHEGGRRVALPFVEAGQHRALVGMIVGPAAAWYRAREFVRAGRFGALFPAIRTAWRRTFGRGVRLAGAPGFPTNAQAAFVRAEGDRLKVMAVEARDLGSIADLGWNLITGDWVAANAVTAIDTDRLTLAERRPVLALFDGEPVTLDPATAISAGRTAEQLIATAEVGA